MKGTVSFADVAHQTLIFDWSDPADRLVLKLIDTPWVQRLRSIRQTGNTLLVYMFAEHSRFGHSLGVASLALGLMKKLEQIFPEQVTPYKQAVAAAALLHDVGHVAPGSHLAERIWVEEGTAAHEEITGRILAEDAELRTVLARESEDLPTLVAQILAGDRQLPRWTVSVLSGGGWNADRGNWSIVDSAMCSVSYGRYNVAALIDAFSLTPQGELVLQESRLDALTHFFVARDSMYRQVYQHRVLQVADALTGLVVVRLRELLRSQAVAKCGVFLDQTMERVITSPNYSRDLSLTDLFAMTEHWWRYHLDRWSGSGDAVLSDLATRLRNRELFKTIRCDRRESGGVSIDRELIERARRVAHEMGLDPRYYVTLVSNMDCHRGREEEPPLVLLDGGDIVPATAVEPLIAELVARPEVPRTWVAVPKEVKERLGRSR